MPTYGTEGGVQWTNEGGTTFLNTANNYYVTKTDNGYFLVKFSYNSSTMVIAVRSALEIPSEVSRAIQGTTVTADITTLQSHVSALITNNPANIVLEDTLDSN